MMPRSQGHVHALPWKEQQPLPGQRRPQPVFPPPRTTAQGRHSPGQATLGKVRSVRKAEHLDHPRWVRHYSLLLRPFATYDGRPHAAKPAHSVEVRGCEVRPLMIVGANTPLRL